MTDKAVQEAVLRELEWDPQVEAAHIGVAVNKGAVTLTGHVSSYTEKLAAIRAAERIQGVTAVADEIEVELPGASIRDDTEIAEQIAQTLRWNTLVPDTVHAEVRNEVVILRGEVEWPHQREAAERAVREVTGIRAVTNLIAVKPRVKAQDVKERVAEMIKRRASLDAEQIEVTTTNGTVHLRGQVHSLWEKRLAEQAAASAPGVSKVENELVVVPG
jgi:osmotically-inducible protein OsmY